MSAPAPELLDFVKALARAAEARDFARSSSGVEHAQNTIPGRRAAAGRS